VSILISSLSIEEFTRYFKRKRQELPGFQQDCRLALVVQWRVCMYVYVCVCVCVCVYIYRVFQKDLNDLNLVYFTY